MELILATDLTALTPLRFNFEELTDDDDVYIGENDDIIGCCYCVRSRPAAEEFYK